MLCCCFIISSTAHAGELGNKVWNDLNADGIQDAGEPGIAGVNVSIFECGATVSIGFRTSDSTGKFLFDNLPQNHYQLSFELPSGYEFTLPAQGNVGWQNSDPLPDTGVTPCIYVRDNSRILGYDAGLVELSTPTIPANDTMNVLFILIDDLRPEAGAFGVEEINTPSIDELAQQGVSFSRAYSQVSTCSPSRTSLMTGLRPDTTQVTDLQTHFRDTIPDVVTLPQYFKQNGYRTQGICKVFHGNLDDSESWSEPTQNAYGPGNQIGSDGKILPYAAVDVPDDRFVDHRCADIAIDAIQESQNTPFFITVGFKKPHLPFYAPPEYFEMYDKDELPEASNLFRPHDSPDFAFANGQELSSYSGMPDGADQYDEELRRELKQAYYATTTFVDAQIKRVLNQLDASGLSENTIVVLAGDHGFHLGEQNEWGKHNNFEVGTRVPLIIKAPGKAFDVKTDAIVELVDLYPTIVELAGLTIPTTSQLGGRPLEGDSLVQFIDNPTIPSSRGAFSQWVRGGYEGRSVRTDRWRFIQWIHNNNGNEVLELYDHLLDPSETQNIANQPSNAQLITELKQILDAGPQTDIPPAFQSSIGGNASPIVSFTLPTSNVNLVAPGSITVDVSASDSDGSIASVDLFLNNEFIRTERFHPYLWGDSQLRNLPSGTYTLKAIATDNENATTTVEQVFSVQ